VQKMRRSTLRRMLGAEVFDTELELHRLDCTSSHGMLDNYDFLKTKQAEMAAEPVLPDPLVGGRDIMALGVPEGPEIGKWHRKVYDRQLEAEDASREDLLGWLTKEVEAERASE